jgi:hypothetical protein
MHLPGGDDMSGAPWQHGINLIIEDSIAVKPGGHSLVQSLKRRSLLEDASGVITDLQFNYRANFQKAFDLRDSIQDILAEVERLYEQMREDLDGTLSPRRPRPCPG